MGFGAAAFGKGFRRYSVASLLASLVAGGLSATQGRDLGANRPTPWGGVYERTMISVYLLWMSVLAVVLRASGHAQLAAAGGVSVGNDEAGSEGGVGHALEDWLDRATPPAGAGDGGAAGMGTARHGRAVTVMVELILAEQTLLIVLDDEKGRDTTHWGSGPGLAAAVLLDLARLELIDADADGKIALDGAQPGHELLRKAYATIRDSCKRRTAKGWVNHLPRELRPPRQRLARGLVQRGILEE